MLSLHATVVQKELAGITIAVKEIARRHTTGKTIRIYTDSRQALLTLRNHKIMTRTVWECHEALVVASAANSISVCWVKGHEQCYGNKEADKLARSASGLNIFGPGPSSVLPLSALVGIIKEDTHKEFMKRWDETISCHFAKEFLVYPSKDTAKKYLAMSRSNLRLVTGIQTGHCWLRKHLYNMGKCETPLCRGCEQEDETVLHLLCECTAVSSTRESMLGERWPSMAYIREIPLSNVTTFFTVIGWLAAQVD
uniref:RNase H type-1 domain-containing protein n=1 Tax=Anoplophora glabripennis TaxID=217634 RepID=V5GTB7_ANOGL